MGFSEKSQIDQGGSDNSSNRKWVVIAGISLRAPLKPIYTTTLVDHQKDQQEEEEEAGGAEESSRTPTREESKVLACPPAPRKRKSSLKCNGSAMEFFTPPDLETVFVRRHVERAR